MAICFCLFFCFFCHWYWILYRLVEMSPECCSFLISISEFPRVKGERGLAEELWEKSVVGIFQSPELQWKCFLSCCLLNFIKTPNNFKARSYTLHTLFQVARFLCVCAGEREHRARRCGKYAINGCFVLPKPRIF